MNRKWTGDEPPTGPRRDPLPGGWPDLWDRLADRWRRGRHWRPRGVALHPWLRVSTRRQGRTHG